MKEGYVAPKAELMDFDYKDKVVASNSGRTDEASTEWWTCKTRYVDVMNDDRTVCGYVPGAN